MKLENIDRLIFLHNFRNKRKKPIQLTKTCEGYMLYRDSKQSREFIAVGLKKQQLQYFLQGLTYEYTNEIEKDGTRIRVAPTKENIYLNRLKEQYRSYKKTSQLQNKHYYDAMRWFCLDTQLISFNDIEMLEFEINSSF